MGRTLIIAEKPAQAREYARSLGVKDKRDGYLENEKYVITWCYGHLLELERPEVYMDLEQVGRRWSLKRLPVLPGLREFRRTVKPETRKQYQVIQKWLKSKEIEQVICGTDADREGQLLFQEVYGSEEDEAGSAKDRKPGTEREPESAKDRELTKDTEQADGEDITLPPLQFGENVRTNRVFVEEKVTKPPKRFTQGDLLKAMETAGKQIDDEILRQQLKGKGLDTVATRPAIIENLLQRGYIVQEQKALRPTAKGSELIRLIRERLPHSRLLISAEMTGQMEFDLARVEKGELALEQFMLSVAEAIKRIIEELRSFERAYGKSPLALAPSMSARRTGNIPKVRKSRKKSEGPKESSKSNLVPEPRTSSWVSVPAAGGWWWKGRKGMGVLIERQNILSLSDLGRPRKRGFEI